MKMKNIAIISCALCMSLAALTTTASATTVTPQKEEQKTTATVTFESGLAPGESGLKLIAPSFIFGNQVISTFNKSYQIEPQSQNAILVSDSRGTGSGWTVTAEISSPFTSVDSNKELAGCYLLFKNTRIAYAVESSNPPAAPTSPASVQLENDGGVQTVFSAKKDQGMGFWCNSLGSVELVVAGGTARAEKYEATLLWTLSDVPA